MNLLRNVTELNTSSKLLKNLKRAENFLFSAKELKEGFNNHNQNGNQECSSLSSASAPVIPSSIPSIKLLFREEAQMLPSYLSKLHVDTHHPVMSIARDFYGQNPSMPSILPSLQLRAMFVLLVAKSIELSRSLNTSSKVDEEKSLLVETKQKMLSQITELLFAAHTLHRSIVNVSDKNSTLHQGNKLATLIGDLIMAKTSRRLSDLKNHKVTEIMSNTIAEFSTSGFIGEGFTSLNSNNNESGSSNSARKKELLPKTIINSLPELNYQNWLERSRLGLGSIVGNSCISCMVLAEQEESTIQFASELGRNIGIFLQAYRDITSFEAEDSRNKLESQEFIDFWALPVIFVLEQNPNLLPEDISNVDYVKLSEVVHSSQFAIQNSKHVLRNFQTKILSLLSQLEPSEPISIMQEILNTMSLKSNH